MKKILITAVVLVLGVGAVAYAMSELKEPEIYSWRYKLTVEIDTPEGIKTGSTVREVVTTKYPPEVEGDSSHIETKVKGEAVVVDLGKRGYLFSIMDRDGSYDLPFKVFPGPPAFTPEGLVHYKQLENVSVDIRKEQYTEYSRLVTFEDIKNPKSVRGVHPEKLDDVFGDDVKISKISVEMTSENVSWGIEKILPWLPKRKNIKGYIGGEAKPPYKDPTNTHLTGIEFSRGKFWLNY